MESNSFLAYMEQARACAGPSQKIGNPTINKTTPTFSKIILSPNKKNAYLLDSDSFAYFGTIQRFLGFLQG